MSELIAGLALLAAGGFVFFLLAKKIDILNSDHEDEDFSCH